MSARINKTVAAGFAGVLLAWSGAQAQTSAVCDPMATQNDQARTYRVAQRLADAQKTVDKILAAHPADFRAKYTAALIALDQDRKDRDKTLAAIKMLEATAGLLGSQDAACARAKNFYSIYNTIGVEYYNLGDVPSAKKYFDLANANWDKLDPDTQAKLLDNLGLVSYRQSDFVCAAAYFGKAQKAGSKNAAFHLTLTRKVLSSAFDTRICVKVK